MIADDGGWSRHPSRDAVEGAGAGTGSVPAMDAADQVIALVRDARTDTRPGPVVVAIDGRSGAGKTELARAVGHRLPGARVLSLEDAYRGWSGLRAGVEAVAAGVLAPLARGEAGALRPYDWHAGRLGEPLAVPVPEVLVLEGCGAGSAPCAPYVDVLVWVEAPEPVRHARVRDRDGDYWAEHWQRWAHQEEELLAERDVPAVADLVVRT